VSSLGSVRALGETPPGLLGPPQSVPGRITVRRIIEATAGHFGTTVEALISGRRTNLCAASAKSRCTSHVRLLGNCPLIGRRLGGRHHTTISHLSDAISIPTSPPAKAVDELTPALSHCCLPQVWLSKFESSKSRNRRGRPVPVFTSKG
jgi:hypothetical protein